MGALSWAAFSLDHTEAQCSGSLLRALFPPSTLHAVCWEPCAGNRGHTHVSTAQAVTASPSVRQASGLRSFFLHSMNATLCFEHRVAKCFEMDIRTAEVGGGTSSSDAIMMLLGLFGRASLI